MPSRESQYKTNIFPKLKLIPSLKNVKKNPKPLAPKLSFLCPSHSIL